MTTGRGPLYETRKLSATDSLLLALEEAPPEVREAMVAMVLHYTTELERATKQDPTGMNSAYTVHCLIDEAVERQKVRSADSADIKCRKGCSQCCRQYVMVWPGEAKLLRMFALDQGIDIDEERLARQQGRGSSDWNELAVEDRACVFLDDQGTCRVYEHRPGSCRKYFVVNDPDHCNTVKHPGHKVLRWVSVEAEGVESAALTVHRGSGMANELIKAR